MLFKQKSARLAYVYNAATNSSATCRSFGLRRGATTRAMSAKPEIAITHRPGCMFITDLHEE
jgi:hypothetical protein